MGYVGNSPALKYTSFAVQHFTTSATTGYTLDHAVNNENDIRLVINNVVQQPGSSYAYTASGTTLTLSAATAGTDTMYCVFLGKAVQTVVPGQGSVGADELSANAITGQTALGAEPADTDELLVSDAGALKRVDYSYIKRLSNWSESSGNLLPSNASYGIYLGVNSATAANLLDDYEFGTWTPDADPTSSSFTTKGTMTGYYTKVGNIVHAQAQVNITTAGSASGNIEVYNFPFSSATTGLVHTLNWCRETQIAGANYPAIMSRNVTTVIILAPAFGNGASYDINATYRVA